MQEGQLLPVLPSLQGQGPSPLKTKDKAILHHWRSRTRLPSPLDQGQPGYPSPLKTKWQGSLPHWRPRTRLPSPLDQGQLPSPLKTKDKALPFTTEDQLSCDSHLIWFAVPDVVSCGSGRWASVTILSQQAGVANVTIIWVYPGDARGILLAFTLSFTTDGSLLDNVTVDASMTSYTFTALPLGKYITVPTSAH